MIVQVVVVGAGLAGLVAANRLVAAGHTVTVLDKGRSVGGRLATRRIGEARLDHGAQFFTVRSEAFADVVHGWRSAGLVHEWHRGLGERPDGHPRYACPRGMNTLAKHLAEGLDVRVGVLAFALRPAAAGARHPWEVVDDTATAYPADAVVLTCPVPQSLSLAIGAVDIPADLQGLDYDRTLCLLAVLDRPPALPAPGAVQDGDPVFSFLADNARKGVSALPALTAHAGPAWSLAAWDRPAEDVHADLLAEATARWLGDAVVVTSQLKRWRFATPQRTWPQPALLVAGASGAPVVFAGDAFAGPRVEGAAVSGIAAADLLVG